MAGFDENQEDRTEEATPERREDFRERGQVAVSKDVSSVLVLGAMVVFIGAFARLSVERVMNLFQKNFTAISSFRVSHASLGSYLQDAWIDGLTLMIPAFVITATVAIASTFAQTRLNWSWQKIAPDFSRMNPISGLARMMSLNSAIELMKGVIKLGIIGLLAYLILKGEWKTVPTLMRVPFQKVWAYWGDITKSLFWAVSGLLIVIGAFDYLYNFLTFEKQMKMTKQEVKEEYKKRELDPHVKGRLRRMQRDLATRKIVERTKKATVLITNPTHYSIAIRYELGMPAPIVVAKGMDYMALKMREVAKDNDIPIVENKPLARTLYKVCEQDQEIPSSLYVAVSEVIKYVFNLKGIRVSRNRAAKVA